jgi:hypothetical protein
VRLDGPPGGRAGGSDLGGSMKKIAVRKAGPVRLTGAAVALYASCVAA